LVEGRDLRTLLFCSMRYALGRMTYMPGLVQEMMRSYREVLSADDCKQLAEEIVFYHGTHDGKIGMDFDTRDWLRFSEWLMGRHATLTAPASPVPASPVPASPVPSTDQADLPTHPTSTEATPNGNR
jgi:hypothetical protein